MTERDDSMILTQLNPGPCRTYLMGDEQSKQAALVDPVLEHVQEYLEILLLDTGHFAREEDGRVSAEHIRRFLGHS